MGQEKAEIRSDVPVQKPHRLVLHRDRPEFSIEPLEGLGPIELPGHSHAPVRLEIYVASTNAESGTHAHLELYAAGTMVAESFNELAALELDHAPWTAPSLTGLVDFAELRVAPGSRCGVIPDEIAHDFANALASVEPVLSRLIETKERDRAEQLDENVIRDLRRGRQNHCRRRRALLGAVGQRRQSSRAHDVPGRAVFLAGEMPSDGILSIHAQQASTRREASAAIPVEVVEQLVTSSDEGIPEPELVEYSDASWRSRVLHGRWQVNTAHPDYHASSSRPALKLRYLAALFAKEIVLRSTHDPRLAEPLKQMVEVASYADRQLTERPPRGRRGQKKPWSLRSD